MKPFILLVGAAAAVAISVALMAPTLSRAEEPAIDPAKTLKPVSAFDSIKDEKARSIAIFEETGKVLLDPRCVNCHPKGDSPLQNNLAKHQPPVSRGEANFGMAGMQCTTCHGPANVDVVGQAATLKSIPGNPNWHVAPIEMAWEGKTLAEICVQIKDQNRNGGKTLAQLVEHMAKDDLVGWGWNPGKGREPVAGTQAEFGALYEAWAATGAHCPAS